MRDFHVLALMTACSWARFVQIIPAAPGVNGPFRISVEKGVENQDRTVVNRIDVFKRGG